MWQSDAKLKPLREMITKDLDPQKTILDLEGKLKETKEIPSDLFDTAQFKKLLEINLSNNQIKLLGSKLPRFIIA